MPGRRKRTTARGMDTQRDRGRRKKDHRAGRKKGDNHNFETDSFTVLESWLRSDFVDESGNPHQPSQSFGLKTFLQYTANFDLDPDERLRILAIHWEDECARLAQPKGWNILKRIYQEVLKYDSGWGTHYHSMSLSARTCVSWLEGANPQRAIILNEARSICREGLAVAPSNASLHLSLGRCEYALGDTKQALTHFEDAVDLDAKLMWAVLYRAHCLHDLEQWDDAANAYEDVDLSFFKGYQQWRANLVCEQLAECYLRSGKREKALIGFKAALKRYESNSETLENPDYLIRAAKGELLNEIAVRTIALLKKERFFSEAQSLAGRLTAD